MAMCKYVQKKPTLSVLIQVSNCRLMRSQCYPSLCYLVDILQSKPWLVCNPVVQSSKPLQLVLNGEFSFLQRKNNCIGVFCILHSFFGQGFDSFTCNLGKVIVFLCTEKHNMTLFVFFIVCTSVPKCLCVKQHATSYVTLCIFSS